MIKKTFTFDNVGRYAADVFREKAQFTMSDIKTAIVVKKDNGDALIPLEKMVLLMKHHKILAALPIKEDSPEPIYFMPCVLKSATCAELKQVCNSPDIAPLMIRYKCGYMPLGIFSSLIIGLVSQDQGDWKLKKKGLHRNKIEFEVGDDYDSVTLISRPTFMKIVVFRKSGPKKRTSSVCCDVRNHIKAILTDVHLYMKYSSSAELQYGFECPAHPGKKHLCVHEKPSSNKLVCLDDCTVLSMEDIKYRVWFQVNVKLLIL